MSQTDTKSTTEIDAVVGQRVLALRKAKGLSQTAFGAAIGVTFQQVQKYERGTNRISAARLQMIARLLEVPVSTFYDDAGEGVSEDSPLAFLGLPGAGDLLQAYAGLTPEVRNILLTHARDLARVTGRPELVS